jgi:hypothetical protein
MPIFLLPLVSWLGSAFVTAIVYFTSRKGILFAVLVGGIALIGTATTVLVNEIDALMGSVLTGAAPSVAPFVPDNFGLCITAIISAHLACTGYKLVIKLIKWKTDVMTS